MRRPRCSRRRTPPVPDGLAICRPRERPPSTAISGTCWPARRSPPPPAAPSTISSPRRSRRRSGRRRRRRARHPAFDAVVAPTEIVPFRGGVVRGAVHDENAWALAGDAACGHAGLFGAADDVLALGVALIEILAGERASFLDAAALREAIAPWPGGSHVLGFDTRSGDTPSSGRRFGPHTFGHLGFTGTSLWIDPDARLVGVLLTNRVHPTRDHVAIRAARPVVYDAIAEHAAAAIGPTFAPR